MEFKLNLIAENPYKGELVLEQETPLEGMTFLSAVSCCLRRSIEHVSRARHNILGGLATYEITVPQSMAYESGYFEDTNEVTIIVEKNLLSKFIFYTANVSYGANGRPCFPYMQNEAVLTSLIDEFAFLQAWADTGYANRLMMKNGKVVANNGYYCGTQVGNTNSGIGCGGCTVNVGTGSIALRPIDDSIISGSGSGNTNNGCGCGCGDHHPPMKPPQNNCGCGCGTAQKPTPPTPSTPSCGCDNNTKKPGRPYIC